MEKGTGSAVAVSKSMHRETETAEQNGGGVQQGGADSRELGLLRALGLWVKWKIEKRGGVDEREGREKVSSAELSTD